MLFSYGDGEYFEGNQHFRGKILLSDHKLFLKGPQGDITATYMPLEKIERMRQGFRGVEIFVRPSQFLSYRVLLRGKRKYLAELIRDLVKRRRFVRRWFRNEWVDREVIQERTFDV